jgi:hypothetical protein
VLFARPARVFCGRTRMIGSRVRNGVRFRGGGRAQVPSLPVDDPLTSDNKGRLFALYSQISKSLRCDIGELFVPPSK